MAKKKVTAYKLLDMKAAEKMRLDLVAKKQYAKIAGHDECPHCGKTGMVLVTYPKGVRTYTWLEHE